MGASSDVPEDISNEYRDGEWESEEKLCGKREVITVIISQIHTIDRINKIEL
jgi:hypothetical protein